MNKKQNTNSKDKSITGKFLKIIILFSIFSFITTSCDIIDLINNNDDDIITANDDKIDAVFLAQTHVMEQTQDYFYLVGNRKTLIKAHVISPTGNSSTEVNAILKLNGKTHTIKLNGPAILPASIPKKPGVVQHSFDNSFTGYIPKEWVKTGLSINVESGNDKVILDNLEIGAPTKFVMNMFDFQYFNDTNDGYPAGWEKELESKLPVAGLEIRHVKHVVLKEVVVPPSQKDGIPAIRITSETDYKEQAGINFDTSKRKVTILKLLHALRKAAGTEGKISQYYGNIYGIYAGGGVSGVGNFTSTGDGKNTGVLIHELGHGLSLPHWGSENNYPYKGKIFGIEPPDSNTGTHVGPTWGFDLVKDYFIPPTVQENYVGEKGIPGIYKEDPMQGGGKGDQEIGYLMRHFSDYSLYKIKNHFDTKWVVWNKSLGSYATWNKSSGDYTSKVSNNDIEYPVVRDVKVISIMASVCGAKEDANFVYPPIGPYTAGMIKLFDPTKSIDRQKAESIFCPPDGCDVSLRITQGGGQKIYMLPLSWEPSIDPTSNNSLDTSAINLQASNGEVTQVDLLLTLDVEHNGISGSPRILNSWKK